jgi:hypothetical protein
VSFAGGWQATPKRNQAMKGWRKELFIEVILPEFGFEFLLA